MCKRRQLATVAALVLGVGLAAAQELSPQDKLLAKRAAEADAYRKLAEAVYGLEINSTTHVRDFVTESDDIRTAVDAFVRGVRLGPPTWHDDGMCEVPAEVTVAKVVETLREAHTRHYRGGSVKAEDFESITRRIEKKVISTVGMGAPRMDLPLDLPAGTEELLEPLPEGAAGGGSTPAIWRHVGAQGKLMALRAARLDALRQLAERIKGLRLTSNTQVRDFVTESDVITTEMQQTLVGAEEVARYLHDDELIAEVTMRVPTEQVITTIKSLHTRHYKGDDVKGHDLEEILKTVIKRDFEATGMGVPPQRLVERYLQQTGAQLPVWSSEDIEAVGHGTDPAMDTAQGRLKAARAAEADAKRKLAEQIAGFEIRSATTVKDFVTERDDIALRLSAVMRGAFVTKTEFRDDEAVVTVKLRGMEVWNVLNDGLRRAH